MCCCFELFPHQVYDSLWHVLNLFWFFKVLIFTVYWSIVDLQCCVSFSIQQSDSVIHIFILFQILFPYRLLQNIEWSFCALQQVLVGYLFYKQQCVCLNPFCISGVYSLRIEGVWVQWAFLTHRRHVLATVPPGKSAGWMSGRCALMDSRWFLQPSFILTSQCQCPSSCLLFISTRLIDQFLEHS